MIDLATATALLGVTPKQTAAPPIGSQGGVTKVDGCSYQADPSLGYDVLKFSGPFVPGDVVAGAKEEMGAEPGVTPFDVGLGDASLGFTVAVGGKTMARIEVAKGQHEIAVAVTATDAAKAKSVGLDAARRLVGAVG